MAARDYGQYGGITRALEIVGERWALLIVRDLLVGPRRYGELAAGLPRIPSNILAARLKELQAAGVIRRVPHLRVIVYELTPYGHELEPVVLALGAWGFKAMGDPREEQIITPDSMTMELRTAFRPQVAAKLPATAYAARFGPAELLIRVDGAALDVTRGDGPVDLAFAAGPGIHRVISGELGAGRAISTGVVEVLRGRGQRCRDLGPERGAQRHGHRVGRDDLLLPGVVHRLEAPGAEREHDGLEFATVRGQLADDDPRVRHPAEHAGRLQLLEPRRQDVARNPGQTCGELAVAARPDEQVPNDEQRPAFADQLEGLGDPAVLPVVSGRHRPQACWFA